MINKLTYDLSNWKKNPVKSNPYFIISHVEVHLELKKLKSMYQTNNICLLRTFRIKNYKAYRKNLLI